MKNVIQAIKLCLPKVSHRGKVTLFLYSFSLFFTSVIDGISLFMFANLIDQVNAIESTYTSSSSVRTLLFCIALFLLRSIFASLITWFGIMSFAKEEVLIGQKNFTDYTKIPWDKRSRENLSDLHSFVVRGPNAIIQQLLISAFTLIAEVGSALLIFAFVVSLDWLIALSAMLFFTLIALLQHRITSGIATRTGTEIAESQNQSYEILNDVFNLGKTLQVMKSASLEDQLAQARTKFARSAARAGFLDSFARFIVEAELAIGIVVVGGIIWAIRGPNEIVEFMAIFAIAGFRILPGVNRIQGLLTSIIGKEPLAQLGIRELHKGDNYEGPMFRSFDDSDLILRVSNVSYSFPNADNECLTKISLEFKRGHQYAIVGPSGSGKTTFIDICMGLIEPSEGSVQWANDAKDSIAYVPQETHLTSTSLANNIALEWSDKVVNQERIQGSLSNLSLDSILGSNKLNLDPGRIVISGGQRQRVGILRALYRNAQVIFLDEPTSSLDGESELEVMKAIEKIHGDKTIFIVAHRLSTIKMADEIIYLEDGKVLAVGTFDQLKSTLPQFERVIELSQV
jgi:ABC-type multidrug transport system fused ATPase/permease subunit